MMRWYVVYGLAYTEKRIIRQLNRFFPNTNFIYPKQKVDIIQSGSIKEILKPLFPNYMMIECDLDEDQGLLTKIIGKTQIVSVLKADKEPYPLSEDEIQKINDLINKKIYLSRNNLKGQTIYIKKGPHANLSGLCIDLIEEKNEIVIELKINDIKLVSNVKIDDCLLMDNNYYYEECE